MGSTDKIGTNTRSPLFSPEQQASLLTSLHSHADSTSGRSDGGPASIWDDRSYRQEPPSISARIKQLESDLEKSSRHERPSRQALAELYEEWGRQKNHLTFDEEDLSNSGKDLEGLEDNKGKAVLVTKGHKKWVFHFNVKSKPDECIFYNEMTIEHSKDDALSINIQAEELSIFDKGEKTVVVAYLDEQDLIDIGLYYSEPSAYHGKPLPIEAYLTLNLKPDCVPGDESLMSVPGTLSTIDDKRADTAPSSGRKTPIADSRSRGKSSIAIDDGDSLTSDRMEKSSPDELGDDAPDASSITGVIDPEKKRIPPNDLTAVIVEIYQISDRIGISTDHILHMEKIKTYHNLPGLKLVLYYLYQLEEERVSIDDMRQLCAQMAATRPDKIDQSTIEWCIENHKDISVARNHFDDQRGGACLEDETLTMVEDTMIRLGIDEKHWKNGIPGSGQEIRRAYDPKPKDSIFPGHVLTGPNGSIVINANIHNDHIYPFSAWSEASIEARIEAVIVHEYTEMKNGDDDLTLMEAPRSELASKISPQALEILYEQYRFTFEKPHPDTL